MSLFNKTALIGPTLTLPTSLKNDKEVDIGDIIAYKLFVAIAANDDTGVIIDNVFEGDEVVIYDASGIASFKKTNMKFVKSIVGMANALGTKGLNIATDGAARPFTKAWTKSLNKIGSAIPNTIENANRDAFGQDPGTGDYAKNEGGLIVCMPESKGAIYATPDSHLHDGAKDQGRLTEHYPKRIQDMNSFFPCNVQGGTMSGIAQQYGAIQILAFDSNFKDNSGIYNVGMVILRHKNFEKGKDSRDTILKNILRA